jgi:hypothetical protein
MTESSGAAVRRAKRLVRCYPRAWRARYGEEFTQLLLDDISERPRSLGRTADVLRSGVLARLAFAGLAGDALHPNEQIRVGLATLGFSVMVFLAAGIAIWSQLTIGWQWSAPSESATKAGMLVMTGALVAFVAVALLSAIPVLWTLCREFVRGRGRNLVPPLVALGAGAFVVVVGSIHFGHGWPGTGGHPWSGRDIVPGWVARFCWAATLWITSYWAHPGALATFPASEVAWMVASPIAMFAVVIGVARMLRRLPLSSRVLRYESWLGLMAAVILAAFLAGASSWVISGGPSPRGLFRVGTIDAAGVAVMGAALIVAFRAAQRTLAASPNRAATP